MLWFCGTRSLEISARCRIIDEAVEESQIEFKVFRNLTVLIAGKEDRGQKKCLGLEQQYSSIFHNGFLRKKGKKYHSASLLFTRKTPVGPTFYSVKEALIGGSLPGPVHQNHFLQCIGALSIRMFKGHYPFFTKEEAQCWGARNKSDHPLKVINLEHSEDFKESSCHRLSFSEPLHKLGSR